MEKNSLSQIAIMNVYKRKREGEYLKKLIDISAKPFDIPVQISYDAGELGCWGNFVQALTMDGGNGGTHRMVVHDDISFDRNILEKILYIMKFAPDDKIICLYNPTNSDYIECNNLGKHVLTTDYNFWCQAAIYPNKIVNQFIGEMQLFAKDNRHDDDRLSAYLQMHKTKLFAIVPSLVQHFGAYRSNFKQGGKVGKAIRYSSTYNNQFDVTSVDWEKEFADPYVAKLKKDYVKDVVREEFYEEYKRKI